MKRNSSIASRMRSVRKVDRYVGAETDYRAERPFGCFDGVHATQSVQAVACDRAREALQLHVTGAFAAGHVSQ